MESNGLTPNLETQIQIVESDVQQVMDEYPLFKSLVENKALRRIIEGQSKHIKKFQTADTKTILDGGQDILKSKVKQNG